MSAHTPTYYYSIRTYAGTLYRTHLVSFSSNVILESDRQLSETRVRQMPYSSSLTDKEWVLIEPLLPNKKKTCPTHREQERNLRWYFVSIKKWL